MSELSRNGLLSVSFLLAFTCIVEAQGTRTPLVVVVPGSIEAQDIVKAQVAWMTSGPPLSHVLVKLTPLVVKKNDKYAYLVARASTPGSQPTEFAKDPFLEAILTVKNGHWTSLGYVVGRPQHGGSISDMCGYGDGVGPDVFKECEKPRR